MKQIETKNPPAVNEAACGVHLQERAAERVCRRQLMMEQSPGWKPSTSTTSQGTRDSSWPRKDSECMCVAAEESLATLRRHHGPVANRRVIRNQQKPM